MKFTSIKVRASVQVINIGQPERWNVIEASVDLEEGDIFEDVVDVAIGKVNASHEKHSVSFVGGGKPVGDIFFNVTKNKEERG